MNVEDFENHPEGGDREAVVGIRTLRADLAKFVREARAGRSIQILINGVAQAALVPLGETHGANTQLDHQISNGLILAPLDPRGISPRELPPLFHGIDSASIVQKVRRNR